MFEEILEFIVSSSNPQEIIDYHPAEEANERLHVFAAYFNQDKE
jgi:hypothetical protein